MAEGLAGQKCTACRAGAPQVSDEELAAYLKELPEWRLAVVKGIRRLRRSFRFPDFAAALDFSVRVGRIAEEEGHHPSILTEWGRATVTWWTHSIGGLHKNDFVMAAKTDRLER